MTITNSMNFFLKNPQKTYLLISVYMASYKASKRILFSIVNIFFMYDCHRQSVNNSLFSLCLYFDFTINYGQHSPMFVFVIVFEGESTEGGAR